MTLDTMQPASLRVLLSVALCAALLSLARALPVHSTRDLRMPGVQPQTDDTYLCYPTHVVEDALYITGFEPHADMNVSHHMLLYGCTEPGDTQQVWNCGEMAAEDETLTGPVCKDGAEILYAWAMDAPDLILPADVAFKVGASTNVNWLVLQVHYKDTSSFQGPDAVTDNSGITLETTLTPQAKTAGVYLLGTGGEIPAHSNVYMETACTVTTPVTMHPFAFRAHTHSHGEVVSGYRVHDGQWEEIGRVSPRLPQMFYDVTNPDITVQNGDVLAARCTMKNDEDRTIDVGETQHDEMCNFYVMYWVEGNDLVDDAYCFTDGPPSWSWSNFEAINTLNVPGNASVIPGTEEVIQATEQLFEDTEETLKKIEEALEHKLLELLSGYDYYDNAADNFLYDPNDVSNYNMVPQGSDLNDYYQQMNLDYNQQMSPEELQQLGSDYANLMFDPSYYGDEAEYAQRARDSDNEFAARRFLDYYRDMK